MTARRGRGPAAPSPPGGPRRASGPGQVGRGQNGRGQASSARSGSRGAGGAKQAARRVRGGRQPAARPPRAILRRRIVRRDPIKRLNVGLLLVAFVLSLFAGRLVQLQGLESKGYAEAAVRQRLSRIDLPAVRGDITFAQGQRLAMTVDARVIYADPTLIQQYEQKNRTNIRNKIATTLASMFGLNPATLLQKLAPRSKMDHYRELIHHVEPDKARMVTAMDFTGIGTLQEYRRIYPGGSLAANVAGFVNAEGDGGAGLESSMNKLLKGRSGWQKVEVSEKGQRIPMGEDQQSKPVPGKGLRLTLDQDIQWKAQEAIARQVKATKAQSGTAIVMDPRSGQILAMATAPTFDPSAYWKSTDWGDRAIDEGFEPGSTSKVVTAAAALEVGHVTPDTVFTVPDHITKFDRTFHDSERHSTERLTFGGVLAKSSNVGTIMASDKLTPTQLYQYMRAFGYAEKTGVGLPGESRGLLKPPNQWWGTDRYSIAFGQSVSVNALQVASVYATIADHGVRVTPNLIAGTTDDHGNLTPAAKPAQRRVISSTTAAELTKMLEGVTTKEGTAPAAQIPGYRVAGKTGTAQRVNPNGRGYEGGGYTSTFVGFAPADAPQLVVEVVLQKPQNGYYGGQVAAPVFKDVMSFALQSRRVPPSSGRPQKIRISPDHG
ncbi:penicillin-binding protein 2 [Actinoallomurus purpureus]|uniref:peptidoglycan D,D-transpeptidase FtsI family protein n=1 Tax=Actinoallomurus purpureus TaxID=478114 RepID=UPI002092B9BD|nr:penicillin-binding protein 2 [Actinoallomurus purpureus]MCO6005835.1 penicillin-binding protein 2 [Actinoallomurus purpureus]